MIAFFSFPFIHAHAHAHGSLPRPNPYISFFFTKTWLAASLYLPRHATLRYVRLKQLLLLIILLIIITKTTILFFLPSPRHTVKTNNFISLLLSHPLCINGESTQQEEKTCLRGPIKEGRAYRFNFFLLQNQRPVSGYIHTSNCLFLVHVRDRSSQHQLLAFTALKPPIETLTRRPKVATRAGRTTRVGAN